ncbi:uncharacterized protein G2W53_039817 [Senna tora]|uniref:Uncharacterized protein n=1 Tax=Senna tora TaxID=362788 RepID=A0A834SQK7_9FABA|nr:uncharacterized protein G2W53_039817 [Senna tora]
MEDWKEGLGLGDGGVGGRVGQGEKKKGVGFEFLGEEERVLGLRERLLKKENRGKRGDFLASFSPEKMVEVVVWVTVWGKRARKGEKERMNRGTTRMEEWREDDGGWRGGNGERRWWLWGALGCGSSPACW